MGLLRLAQVAARSVASSLLPPLRFAPTEVSKARLGERLPRGFLLGAATASHQVEGGNTNDWTDWEQGSHPDGKPHVLGGPCGVACDSWNRFDEDVRLLGDLGANAYRFSVEWSRLQPDEGSWNEPAAERYRAWLRALAEANIATMLTLHHFTLPRWVAAWGGWESDRTIFAFTRFAQRAAQAFGKEGVRLWCTINEPNVLAVQGYHRGVWPPGIRDEARALRVLARELKGHARARAAIKESTPAIPVGIAHHMRAFKPATVSVLDVVIAGVTAEVVNDVTVNAARTGRIQITVPGKVNIDEQVPDLRGSFDYLGVNYYSRDHIRADLREPSLSRQFVPDGHPVSDLGWEIYPEGLYALLKQYSGLGWPIYVTENGLADASGHKRTEFLRSHLYAVERAAREGVDVRGYFHWSLIDNFEWAEGFWPRFGLYRVDFNRPERPRSATPAVALFQDVARRLKYAEATR